jgi:geranylgeranyl diphosphate synthase type 3
MNFVVAGQRHYFICKLFQTRLRIVTYVYHEQHCDFCVIREFQLRKSSSTNKCMRSIKQGTKYHLVKMEQAPNEHSPEHDEMTRAVLDPFLYLIKNSEGKGIRSKLIEAFNVWLRVPEDKIEVVKRITEKLHNASLMIDDVEDNSRLRRGIPCAHLLYGVPATINSANYVYFEALKDTQQLQSTLATAVFVDELLNLHKGQAMDIHWRDNSICPSEEDYLEMVKNKTGGLFRLSVGIMQAVSDNKK